MKDKEIEKLAHEYNPVQKLDAEFIRSAFVAGYKKAMYNYSNSKKMKRIFEIYLGWLFVNGRKQEQWYNYLKERYGK
jgi:hypothetical protein